MPPLLDFAAQYPWIAFGLSWPTALVLVTVAYLFAAQCEVAMNLVLRLCTLVANSVVILIRGYAPQSIEAAPPAAPEA